MAQQLSVINDLQAEAWATYSPTTTLTGATLGNATSVGAYIAIGKTINFWQRFTVGSTTNFTGLVNAIVTLPTNLSTNFDNATMVFGAGTAHVGAAFYPLHILRNATGNVRPVTINAAGTNAVFADITAAIPAAWGVGDSWFITGTYEAA